MTHHPTPANWFSVLALGFIWGGTFMVVSVALGGYGPVTVACARTTLGAVALLAVMRIGGRAWPSRAAMVHLLPIGALNTALPFVLLSWGQQYVTSAFAGLTMAAVPIFIMPLAHLFSDEHLTGRKAAGMSLGFAGALVLIGPGLFLTGAASHPLAQLACFGAALSYATSSVMTRRCPPVDPISMAAVTLGVGAVILVPTMLLVEGLPTWQGPLYGSAILFLGLVPTALAALLRVAVIRTAGSIFMSVVNYQVPVWSMIFGWLLLSEVIPARFFGALALILLGLAVSQWRGGVTRVLGPRA
jgi:drug/metabolite transporter (DMT)-like permease